VHNAGPVERVSVQAGAVHGDSHLNSGRPILPPRRQLPPGMPRFFTRDALVRDPEVADDSRMQALQIWALLDKPAQLTTV
jgi:hypothetical protein